MNQQNPVDREFVQLMAFIQERSQQQILTAINQNLAYLAVQDPKSYWTIINYYNTYPLWGRINPEQNIFELTENRAHALTQYREQFQWLYSRLADYRSKKLLTSLLSHWLTFNLEKVAQLKDPLFRQYFDLDLIHCTPQEVFVDIGAYIGDTLVDYVKHFGPQGYHKIYCYEIVPANINYLKKNISLFQLKNVEIREKGAAAQEGLLYLSGDTVSSVSQLAPAGALQVPTVAIDKDITEPVTFIKMDIEGAEEDALQGCLEQIRAHHPKLALSVYHNHKDLWKLAHLVDQVDPTYRFYLRYYGYERVPTEYVLYGI